MSSIFKGTPMSEEVKIKELEHNNNINTELEANIDSIDPIINVEIIKEGKDGASIEYQWRGTELGIRVQGEDEYVYMDLTSDMEIDRDVLIRTLGFEPAQADLLQAHLNDLSIHITPEERKRWNDSVDLSDVYDALNELSVQKVDFDDYNMHVQSSNKEMGDIKSDVNTLKIGLGSVLDDIKILHNTKADRAKVIQLLEQKSDKGHNHDDLYATKAALEDVIVTIGELIPSKISQLENDLHFVTKQYIEDLGVTDVASDLEELKKTKADIIYVDQQIESVYDKLEELVNDIEIPGLESVKRDIENLNQNKVDKIEGKTLSSNDFTDELLEKLNNIESGANKYTHPQKHPASIIEESESKKFVSDFEKDYWGNKANKSDIPTKVSQLVNDEGYITKEDLPETAGDIDALTGRVDAIEKTKVNKTEHEIAIKKLQSQIDQIDIPTVDLKPIQDELLRLDSVKLDAEKFNALYKELEDKINAIKVPESLSELADDVGYLTGQSEEISSLENDVASLKSTKADNTLVTGEIARLEKAISELNIPDEVDLTPINKSIEELSANKIDRAEFEKRLDEEIMALIDGAPEALDTLGELAKALGEDANFSVTVANMIAEKVSNEKFNTEIERLEKRINNLDIPDGVDLTPVYAEIDKLKANKLDVSKFNEEMAKVATIEYVVAQLENKANVEDMPTKISELINDAKYITLEEVPKVDLTDINSNINILKESKADKSAIPTKLSELSNDAKFITIQDVPETDLSGVTESVELNSQEISKLKTDKANKTDIPTKLGQLTNDKGYITLAQVPETDLTGVKASIANLENTKADKDSIPTKVTQLENDAQFITLEQVPETDLSIVEDSITQLQKSKADKTEIPTKVSELVNDTNFITVEQVPDVDLSGIESEISTLSQNKADKTSIPTKVSDLSNDSKFITLEEVPEVDLSQLTDDISQLKLTKASIEMLEAHTNNMENPHKVTKAQIGLSNVDNTSDLSKPISKATKEALELKADKTSVPSKLSQLENDSKYITLAEVPETDLSEVENSIAKLEATKANKTEVDTHIANVDNPHKVTKAQIGLSNVDNTKDVDKPMSIATKAYVDKNLATKQNTIGYTPENVANKGKADGYTPLDANAKVPLQYIPDIAKQQTYVVETKEEMDKLSKLITGEKCYVTGVGDSYIWNGTAWQVLSKADWENVNLDWENIANRPKSSQSQIDGAVTDSHKHANKTVLDKITDAVLGKIEQAFNHISDAVKHITGEERKLWNTVSNKADKTELTTHTSNTSNPHKVTKSQVGLSNVDNTSDANKPISIATQKALDAKANKADVTASLELKANKTDIPTKVSQLSNDSKFITLAEVPEVDLSPINNNITKLQDSKADKTELNSHTGSKSNPHSVTKTQVGLGNVDNTADIDKPVSKPTEERLKDFWGKDELEIGGRNLFTTVKILDINYWENLTGGVTSIDDDTIIGEIEDDSGTPRIRYNDIDMSLEPGLYTLSYDYYSDSKLDRYIIIDWRSAKILSNNRKNISVGWNRFHDVFLVDEDTQISINWRIPDGNMRIRNIKLEKGNIATDWTPAPEDIQAQIDDVIQSVENIPEVFHDLPQNEVKEEMTPAEFDYGVTLCSQSLITDFPSINEYGVSYTIIGKHSNYVQLFITRFGDIWSRRSTARDGWNGEWYNSKRQIDFLARELNVKANKTDIPTKLSQLENDSGFDVIEDRTTKTKYKIIMDNGVPYFEEI